MQATLKELPEVVNEAINYEAEFHEPNVRNGIVTCAALSLNGHYIALGFGSGIIEVADIEHQHTICRLQRHSANLPAWIEFVHGSCQVATEDNDGNVTILGDGMAPVNLGTLPTGSYPAGTAVSDDGLFVVRVPRSPDNPWYDSMMLISVFGRPSIQRLASPPISPSSQSDNKVSDGIPNRRTLGFSPGARYVGAFDETQAVTWSTESCECIAVYRVTDFYRWIINPTVPPTHSYVIPDPIFARATLPSSESGTAYAHHSEVDAGHDSDESWIKRPFYDLSPSNSEQRIELLRLPAATRTPLIEPYGSMWLNGRAELELPRDYGPIDSRQAWYGDQVPYDSLCLFRPQSSRDGTRFLLQGQARAPIVVDISQVI
ncbi:uncharacterized protein EI90DRAFT_3034614 [Cantharellus anzutake]|uniref:uncharacterized protein n=1 Tax=Cantharellus anzutake TaxID=1750568 RepID=UPI0019046984|nr:uncharacterized protein EI90DRAFT_3034614 [Cantharellus anzutake]KAF8341609.1 hypothetical protein EI90DRAFT_3034614 [Cantharellus anzutake]